MIFWLAPSLTKKVPIIEVMMQTPPMRQRIEHQVDHVVGCRRRRSSQHHGRHHGHRVGLEEVGRHAGAVADVVTDVVGNHRRVAGVVLGNAGLDLAHQVGADVGALGEDTAAETREDRDQGGAEAKGNKRINDHGASEGALSQGAGQHVVVDRQLPRSARPATSMPVMAPALKGNAPGRPPRLLRRSLQSCARWRARRSAYRCSRQHPTGRRRSESRCRR